MEYTIFQYLAFKKPREEQERHLPNVGGKPNSQIEQINPDWLNTKCEGNYQGFKDTRHTMQDIREDMRNMWW